MEGESYIFLIMLGVSIIMNVIMMIENEKYQKLTAICKKLLQYRKRNLFSWQMEKADEYFSQISYIIEEEYH